MRVIVLALLLCACGTSTDSGGRDANSANPEASITDAGNGPAGAAEADSGDATLPEVLSADGSSPFVDPLQCHLLCASADAANCANAPDHQTCVDLCQRSIDRCPVLVTDVLDCFGPVPSFSCDADGNLASNDCASELSLVQQCAAESDAG